jgi:hypothetical protein
MTNNQWISKEKPPIYEIRVEGLVDSLWAEWFDGMAITYAYGKETILTGELQDQTALHGVLGRIRDLGINLVSVRRLVRDQQGSTTQEGNTDRQMEKNDGFK